MHIKIVNYALSASPMVQAFVDIVVDNWLRINGVNLLRDGGLMPPQLSYNRSGKRNWLSAVVVIDDDLRELLSGDILAAITTYVASLPPEQRMRPPRPAAAKPPQEPANAEPPLKEVRAAGAAQVSTRVDISKTHNGKPALPPPRRLLAGI